MTALAKYFLCDWRFSKVARFCLVGGLDVAVGTGLMWLFCEVFNWWQWLSYVTSSIVAFELNFVLNSVFTWRDWNFRNKVVKFHLCKGGLTVLSFCLFPVITSAAAVNYWIVYFGLLITFVALSFVINDKAVFRSV